MELLNALTDRGLVIALAILGAIIATAGAVLGNKSTGHAAKLRRVMMWTGYSISFASVVLFIVAGFLSGR
jgi:hypothetical protein